MRKYVSVISIIFLISGLFILGYFIQKGKKVLLTDPYRALSNSSVIVIETIDLQGFINSITTGKGIFGEIGTIKEFSSFSRKTSFLADQLGKQEYKKLLSNTPSLISFISDGRGKLRTQLSLVLPAGIKERHIKEALKSSGLNSTGIKNIAGIEVTYIPYVIDNVKDTVFIALTSGLLTAATSEWLIKMAILQVGSNSDLRDLPGFSQVRQASGKNEDKIFIVYDNLRSLITPILKSDFADLATDITNLAICGGYDILMNNSDIALNGYTETLSNKERLFRFKEATPGLFHTYRILPAATILFETIMNPRPVPGKTDTPATQLSSKLREYLGEEVTKAIIDIRGRPLKENKLIIYELRNREFAEKRFREDFELRNSGDKIIYFQPDEQVKIPVYLTEYRGFSKTILPFMREEFDDSYFAFYDNFLITGSSFVAISRLLYDNLLNKTLSNDLIYRDFENTLPSIAGYYLYMVPGKTIDYLTEYFSEDFLNSINAARKSINKIQAAGLQFVTSNRMLYNSISVRFKDEVREESTTEWETLLDTVAAIKPFFFTNHITGMREIFIQDQRNNAYLINSAGRVLWKVPLNERINGNVYMVDYLRNNKYQLLFSGKEYLHLLDRNGNYVERYPVKLRSRASNPMALFDYDDNRNYRIIIAGEDRQVYAYDINGSSVKGWKPFRTGSTVRTEVAWFRVSGKDYLAVSDESSLYLLDRTGNVRVSLSEPVARAKGSSLRYVSGKSPYIVCTSPDGTVKQIFFDGTVNKKVLRQFSADHSFDFFDVDGNGFGEYIFIDRGILYLYDNNGTEMITREFGSGNIGGPITFVFSARERKIGVFDLTNELIYLIDSKGATMKGFPLRGASMFSVGRLSDRNSWQLIVGGTDKFLYNYKLNTEEN